MSKINNLREYFCHIQDSNSKFSTQIKNCGGLNVFLRAFAAQLLLLTLYYNVGILLIPFKDFLFSNAILMMLVVLLSYLWRLFKERCPDWIDNLIKGNCFYDFNLGLINKCIIGLFLCNLGILGLNLKIDKKK